MRLRFLVALAVLGAPLACGACQSARGQQASTTAAKPADRVDEAVAKVDADVQRLRAKYAAEPKSSVATEAVAAELAHMVEVDQLLRSSLGVPFEEGFTPPETKAFEAKLTARWGATDRSNTRRVSELVDQHGWFRISTFGEDADRNGWLLVQHADHDLELQKRILGVLEPLVAAKETSPSHFAYLYDRVATHENRPQRYGTQGECAGPGVWRPGPIEDAAHVDERRNAVGLAPLADYAKGFVKLCH